jgi:hypothetical protein
MSPPQNRRPIASATPKIMMKRYMALAPVPVFMHGQPMDDVQMRHRQHAAWPAQHAAANIAAKAWKVQRG